MSNQTPLRPSSTVSDQGTKTAQTPAPGRSGGNRAVRPKKTGPSSRNRNKRPARPEPVSLKRAGTPWIFGWGSHLSRLQRSRIENRATWAFGIVAVVLCIAVLGFGLLQQNVLIPRQAIVKVNGTSISQDTYRKYLAYESQVLWNKLQNEITRESALAKKAQAGDKTASQQDQALIAGIQADEGNYSQSSITQNSVNTLVEDQLIQAGMTQFEQHGVKPSVFALTNSAVQARLKQFKASFPKGDSYQKFLNADSLSNDDVLAAIRVDMRRELMQPYLSSIIVSPTLQLHMRRIELQTKADAVKVRADLAKNDTDAEWAKEAKIPQSVDVSTRTVGGDMGWVFKGNADPDIENWAFSPAMKVGALSPIIKDISGTYDVVQVLGVDPHRAVDPSALNAAKNNALSHWLSGQKNLPTANITTPDSTMLLASRNMPVSPNLNATLPSYNTGSQSPGATGG